MSVYDEIEIEDLDFDQSTGIFTYSCPCGDRFRISLDELKNGKNIAACPSCSLEIKIIFDDDNLKDYKIVG